MAAKSGEESGTARDRAAKRAGVSRSSPASTAPRTRQPLASRAPTRASKTGLGGFEGTVAGCDREKRRAYFAGKFRVGDDRHVDFEA